MTIDILSKETTTSASTSVSTSTATTTPRKPDCPDELYLCSDTMKQGAPIANEFKSQIYGKRFILQNGNNVVYKTENNDFAIWRCQTHTGWYWNLDYSKNMEKKSCRLKVYSVDNSRCGPIDHWKYYESCSQERYYTGNSLYTCSSSPAFSLSQSVITVAAFAVFISFMMA